MKKLSTILKALVLVMPLIMAACATHKKVTETKTVVTIDSSKVATLQRVSDTANKADFVTSKMKFTIKMGALSQSLTGNLKMKRNDVIRLQLMAFGFVEAGRLEFTKDYVLIIDRINKQFLRAPYHHLDFLRKSGINFYTLQAMFWNELFLPGNEQVTPADYEKFDIQHADENTIISYDKDEKMLYSWLTDAMTGRIKMANVVYTPLQGASSQLNWDYQSFSPLGRKMFPDDMKITLTTASKEVKMELKLNYLGNESDWETRTQVSAKYNEVTVDEILRRFMAL